MKKTVTAIALIVQEVEKEALRMFRAISTKAKSLM